MGRKIPFPIKTLLPTTLPQQTHLPRMEADRDTHRRDCECARCEAGFSPSEGQRQDALSRWEERQARQAAEVALARQRERERVKALRLTVALEQDEKRTADRLARQTQLLSRLQKDERLETLLRLRRAGRSIGEALAEVDRKSRSG